jgi:hypothetical protein
MTNGEREQDAAFICVCTFAWRVAHAVDHLSLPELHRREAVAKLHTVRSKSKRTSLCESFLGTIFATNKRNILEQQKRRSSRTLGSRCAAPHIVSKVGRGMRMRHRSATES